MPRILVKKREEIISEYVARKTKVRVLIGSKKGNDIVIADKNVSEQHCVVSLEASGQYSVKDLNTIAGTQLNSRLISESPLKFGDEILLGDYKIVFLDDMAANKYDVVVQQYYLIGIYGKFYGKKYFIKQQGDTFIGRENLSPRGIENDIVLSGDMTVSKGHAKITAHGDKHTITDIGSTGGVAVNGAKVGQLNTIQLSLNDEISIGRTIFRFVDYFSENYALPSKQKVVIMKVFNYLQIAVTAIALILGCLSIWNGYSGISILNDNQGKVNLSISQEWNKTMPLSSPESYDVTATPVIANFTGSHNNIAMLTSSGLLNAWDFKTGDPLWKPFEIYNSGVASLVSSDINNDGYDDIIAVSETSMVFIVDGQTGNIIRKEILGGDISKLTPVVCDLDSDGKKDIVVASEDGTLHFMYSPGFDTTYVKQTEFIDGPIYGSPIIMSRKNFSPFVVVANYDSKVYFLDGKTRTKKIVNLLELSGKAHLVAGAPALGDINGDGIDEVIVQSSVPQYISAIDTTKFSVIWTYFVEPTPPGNMKNTTPIVADFSGDKIGDVAFVSANGTIQILKGNTSFPTGELLWNFTIPGAGKIISSPSAYDFDKDGIPDLVFGTEDGRIIIAKSNTKRKEIEILADLKASNSAITSTPLIADLNGDKYIEILYTNVQDAIQVLNTNSKTLKNLKIWPMFLCNAEHNAQFSLKQYKDKYIKMFGFGVVLFILILFLKVRGIIKKAKKKVKVIYL